MRGVLRIPFGAFAATWEKVGKKHNLLETLRIANLGSLAVCCAAKQLVELGDKQLVGSRQVVPDEYYM